MAEDEATPLAHREAREVPVLGGRAKGKVRPWTMAQRAELKPKLFAVLERVQQNGGEGGFNLATMMLTAEDELCDIARSTLELPDDVKWDDLYWEDLPTIVQAIWETSVVTIAGGGIAGKALGLVASVTRTLAVRGQAAATTAGRDASQTSSPSPIAAAQN